MRVQIVGVQGLKLWGFNVRVLGFNDPLWGSEIRVEGFRLRRVLVLLSIRVRIIVFEV